MNLILIALQRVDKIRSLFKPIEDFIAISKASRDHSAQCPICGFNATKSILFGRAQYVNGPSAELPEVKSHRKFLCEACGHFFTSWLDGDLSEVSSKYQGIYNNNKLLKENGRASYQLGLMKYVLQKSGGIDKLRILDFGCGPNVSPTKTMRAAGHDVHCCDILDIYPYDGDVFFRYDLSKVRSLEPFDAIVSIDVVEHLGNTFEAWRGFNKMLKLGGKMAHCFPSRFHYSLRHKYCTTPFHTCIFSKQSLSIILKKAGFQLSAIDPFSADVPYVFYFEKVMEID